MLISGEHFKKKKLDNRVIFRKFEIMSLSQILNQMAKRLFTSFFLLLALYPMTNAKLIDLRNLAGRNVQVDQGTSWGVPFAKGTLQPGATFTLTDRNGRTLESTAWPLAWWPDGSIKWMGLTAITSEGLDQLSLDIQAPSKTKPKAPTTESESMATQSADGIRVNTGAMTCFFPSAGKQIIRDLSIGGNRIASDAELIALLGDKEFTSKVETVTLLQDTPIRVQVKIVGKHATDRREWLPFTLYCVMYKHMPTITLTHSFLFDSDGQTDRIAGLGIRFNVPFRDEVHNRHARFAGDGSGGSGFWCQPVRLAPGYRPSAGRIFTENYQEHLLGKKLPNEREMSETERAALQTCPIWGDMRLVQNSSNGFVVDKRTTPKSSWLHVTDGGRSLGGVLLGDTSGSIFVGIKDFWQTYPAALHIDHAGEDSGALTAWLWSPDGEPMDMRHYDTQGHDLKINYEDYKEGWESPYGVGHRSTVEIRLFESIPPNDELWKVAEAVQKPVQYTCTPEYFYSVHAFGDYWALPDPSNSAWAEIERQLNEYLAFWKRQIDERSWYGFWNYGDAMHNYDFTRHDWRYDIGGWAWNNVELAPNVLLWTCFLRTGREDIWTMAEALEKHASEVDVHHLGRFAPLGSRHNVSHWGDGCKQPRIEYAAMKRYLYYLTGGDALTGDRMTEQISSDKAYDYARRISTWGAVSGTYLKSSLNEWGYYAGNWMLEWERTGNTYWRDRLLNSMKDLVALGQKSGRLTFDYYDPETGRFLVYLKEDPDYKGFVDAPKSDFVPAASLSKTKLEKIIGYRNERVRPDTFSTIFGIPEFFTDFRATVEYPEFWRLVDNSFRDISRAGGNSMTGPRMAAWVAHVENDPEIAALAWKNLLDNGSTDTESDGTPVAEHPYGTPFSSRNVIKPVEEPQFLGRKAGWQRHMPATTQWLLNAVEVMAWTKNPR